MEEASFATSIMIYHLFIDYLHSILSLCLFYFNLFQFISIGLQSNWGCWKAQLLALREVIREAIAAVLDDVKTSITEAIRSSLREEVPQVRA